jgi:uncharacterized sulfatase
MRIKGIRYSVLLVLLSWLLVGCHSKTTTKKPAEELYNIQGDPYCYKKLAMDSDYDIIRQAMKEALLKELQHSNDPRVLGPDKEIFDSYLRYMSHRHFPKPEWADDKN